MPKRPTRPNLRARWEGRRQELIDVAARLFAEQGYQATSMAELTEATGLAAGGIYHYFEGKDALLIAICDELLDPLLIRAREVRAEGGSARDQFGRVMRVWLEHVAVHRHHLLVFSQERHAIERQPRWRHVRAQRKEFETVLDDILRLGETDGTLAFKDRRLVLLAVLGMVNYTPVWLRPRGRLDADEIADGYLAIVFGEAGDAR